MLERTVLLPHSIDLPRTFGGIRRGQHDPTCRIDDGVVWRASRHPAGPVTLRLERRRGAVDATAWGEGAEAALDAVPNLIGCNDDDEGFEPEHPLVARLFKEHRDLRIPKSGAVAETLVNVVLEQRVTTFEARRAQSQIVERWGEPAPGPADLRLPPDPEVLANVAYYDLHIIGVERKRADTVRRVAASHRRLDALALLPPAEAHARLMQLPGVGPWSAAEVALVALGDADAVSIGDVHLPSIVTYALGGEAIDDDDAMLEALEPFAGHRGRVIRLLGAAGIRPPARSPRYAPRDIRQQ